MIYEDESGGVKDAAKAEKAYRDAVAQHHNGARVALGDFLRDGRGGRRDVEEARDLYEHAAGNGYAVAKDRLAALPPRDPNARRISKPVARSGSNDLLLFEGNVVLGQWVVSRNPEQPGKLFVHRSQLGNALVDPLYLVREDSGTWWVHRATPGPIGLEFGPFVGSMPRPARVQVSLCSCR